MKKLASVLAVFLLLFYIGYQVISNLTEQIETIDALIVKVEDKITCRGIFVREGITVSSGGRSSYEFLVENGEKVSKGQAIAVCFSNSSEAERFRDGAALEKDVAYAEEALKSIQADSSGAALDIAIFDSMEAISGKLSRGRAWEVGSLYSSLTQSVIAREYPREDIAGLERTLAELKNQLVSYRDMESSGVSITANEPGYFVKAAEGAKTLCTPNEMYELTPADVEHLCTLEAIKAESGDIGYIVSDFQWYYVCSLSASEAAAVEKRGRVDISFPYMTSQRVEVNVHNVKYFDSQAVVIFSCGQINEELLGGVCETADIIKQSYSGIRLPREALHMSDGQWGVYCLSGAVVKFKPVELVFQGDSFYLAEPASSAKDGLYLYDKIIVKGKNLEANMIIK